MGLLLLLWLIMILLYIILITWHCELILNVIEGCQVKERLRTLFFDNEFLCLRGDMIEFWERGFQFLIIESTKSGILRGGRGISLLQGGWFPREQHRKINTRLKRGKKSFVKFYFSYFTNFLLARMIISAFDSGVNFFLYINKSSNSVDLVCLPFSVSPILLLFF